MRSSVGGAPASERERIIEAAYRCLAGSLGGSLSVTDILASAGLSTRAFYRHFASKDGLLMAMFRRDSERVLAELQEAATGAPNPPEALRRWIEGMLRLTAEARRRRRVLILSSVEVRRAAGFEAERERFIAAQTAALAHILYRGREEGHFRHTSPDADARAIRAVLSEAFEAQMTGTASVDAEQAAAQVADFAFRALGAHPHPAASGPQPAGRA